MVVLHVLSLEQENFTFNKQKKKKKVGNELRMTF